MTFPAGAASATSPGIDGRPVAKVIVKPPKMVSIVPQG
jgi:hypothetical protein